MSEIEEFVAELTEIGLLTERQAEAYVHREIEATPRSATAELMGISKSALDTNVQRAKRKIEQASETLDAIEDYATADVPEQCTECGDRIGQAWTQTRDGDALCLDCADIDEDAALMNK